VSNSPVERGYGPRLSLPVDPRSSTRSASKADRAPRHGAGHSQPPTPAVADAENEAMTVTIRGGKGCSAPPPGQGGPRGERSAHLHK